MHAAVLFTAAFAAAVLASPVDKRDAVEVTVTATDLSYVTNVVTVTAGQAPATTSAAPIVPAAASSTSAAAHQGWWRKHRHSKKPQPTSAPASSSAPVGYPTAPASSSEPAPMPSSETAPVSSSAPAPMPSTAPATTSAPPPSSYPAPSPAPAPTTSTTSSVSGAKWPPAATATILPVDQAGTVGHHNVHRANYSSPDLVWDDDLAKSASAIASSCYFDHQMKLGGGGYGQNIAAGDAPERSTMGYVITNQFFNGEVEAYNDAVGSQGSEPNMDNFLKWGHFSQVVWAASTKAACVTASCPGGMFSVDDTTQEVTASPGLKFYTVCNYSPPGNVAGGYAENIGTCKDQPTSSDTAIY